jgi:hypothetical protein
MQVDFNLNVFQGNHQGHQRRSSQPELQRVSSYYTLFHSHHQPSII